MLEISALILVLLYYSEFAYSTVIYHSTNLEHGQNASTFNSTERNLTEFVSNSVCLSTYMLLDKYLKTNTVFSYL